MLFKSNLFAFCCIAFAGSAAAQEADWYDSKLNTAVKATYMRPYEREMIYELNRLRSDPPRYAKLFVALRLKQAVDIFNRVGKGDSSYSITTHYSNNVPSSIDTNWHFSNEEDLHALQTLYDTLMHLKPLPILFPDEGIYKACIKHAKDQSPTGTMNHQGTDGSWPWERITKYSPAMADGNENLAYNGQVPPRQIVLQLLEDGGIPGYGHRYNMLDIRWNRVACYRAEKPLRNANWWIQEFAVKR